MKAEIWCDDCNKEITINFEQTHELFDMICPKCKSRNIWFREIESGGDKTLPKLGRGGCSQK